MENRTKGWIEVICGSMFSGKTEELLRRIRRGTIASQSVLLVKPAIDKRYSDSNVVSHEGRAIEAKSMRSSLDVLEEFEGQGIVGIDEAQFFDDSLLDVVQILANKGVRVIVAGLDMDFKGKPFGTIPQLLAMAEYVTKIHAICMKCGNLAQYSHRNTENKDDQLLIGAKEIYEPLCRTCFNKENS
jgi:thymidine kinase